MLLARAESPNVSAANFNALAVGRTTASKPAPATPATGLPMIPNALKRYGAAAVRVPASAPSFNLFSRRRIASSLPDKPTFLSVNVGPPSTQSPIVVVPSLATIASAPNAAALCWARTVALLPLLSFVVRGPPIEALPLRTASA